MRPGRRKGTALHTVVVHQFTAAPSARHPEVQSLALRAALLKVCVFPHGVENAYLAALKYGLLATDSQPHLGHTVQQSRSAERQLSAAPDANGAAASRRTDNPAQPAVLRQHHVHQHKHL